MSNNSNPSHSLTTPTLNSNSTSPFTTFQTVPTHKSNTPHINNLINISTINVRGLNSPEKLHSLTLDLANSRSIICCSETKNNIFKPLSNHSNTHTIISSKPSNSAKNGASIIIGKDISDHIYQTYSYNEFWCSAHLKFRPKIDCIITAIYLPHDNDERKLAVQSLTSHLKKFQTSKYHHIIAGDFNTYPQNSPAINAPTTNSKRKIYKQLSTWIDVAKATNKDRDYTHITPTSASRIDQIWISKDLANKIIDVKTFQSDKIITDHKFECDFEEFLKFRDVKMVCIE